jgi:AraC-like DNA-binding protein
MREQPAHTVPLFLVARLLELVERWHVPASDLLSGTGLTPDALSENPFGRLPVQQMCAVLTRARRLTGEPGLGYYHGLQMRAPAFGTLGLAMQTSPSVRQALEVALKFSPVFSTALSLTLRVDRDVATLSLDENVDLGEARDIVVISMMLGIRAVFWALTGREDDGAGDLAIAEPAYQVRFAHLVPRWRFGQSANRLIFGASTLDLPVVTADSTGLRVARTLCERALDALGYDSRIVDCVRGLLAREEGGFRSVDEIASRIHLSPRTLKRRLAAQGATFSALVEQERRERAMVLLRSRHLSVAEVANHLDYATASTFVRAFHRWTGTTPAAYRRRSSPSLSP